MLSALPTQQQSQWGPSHHTAEWLQPMSLRPTQHSGIRFWCLTQLVLSFHRSFLFFLGGVVSWMG